MGGYQTRDGTTVRNGVAAMLLLGVLNVDEETIMEDFLLTNVFFETEISAMRKQHEPYIQDEAMLEEFMVAGKGVYAPYMQNAINYIKDNYGVTYYNRFTEKNKKIYNNGGLL